MSNKSLLALLCSGYMSLAIAAAPDRIDSQELRLPDVRAELTRPRAAAATLTPLSRSSDGAGAMSRNDPATISIDVELLKAPSRLDDRPSAAVRPSATSQLRDLSLPVDGQELQLRVIDTTYDPTYELYHSTALILNRARSYARFSFDQQGRVAGTITLPGATYRVLQEGSTHQRIVRSALDRNNPSASPATQRDHSLRVLERRHAQAEIVAELQPRVFMLARSNLNVLLEGERLGTLEHPERINSAALLDALVRLAPLTNATNDTQLRIRDVHVQRDQRRVISYEQLINGIPVLRRNEIVVSRSGQIVSINSSLLSDDIAVSGVTWSEQQALQSALAAVQAKHRSASELQQVKPASLRYEIVVGGGAVEPIYQFFIRATPRDIYDVRVSAATGAAEILPGGVQAIEVYRATSGAPVDGNSPGAELVWGAWQDGVGSPCVPGYAVCSLYSAPRVAYYWSYYWNLASFEWNEGACCENIDVDIVANTSAAPDGGEYVSANNSIIFPPSGNGANGQNPDAVLHELGHAYIDQYNLPGTVGTDQVSLAIREGLADVVAATYPPYEEDQVGYRLWDYGADWVIFDGQGAFATSVRRDLTVPRQWSHVATANGPHDAALAIGNFFYRLKLGNMYSYPVQYVQFLQRVMYKLQDYEGDGQIDLLDLKQACIEAVAGTGASVAYINSTWEAMSQQQVPGGEVPAPPGAPSTPAGLLSVPTGCVNGFSTYTVHWDAPANTTYYITYVRLPNSPLYSLSDRINAPQNYAFGWTNYDTDGRVSACNSAGCSLMSAAAPMPHNQCAGF